MMPRMTKKIKIPAFQESLMALMKPTSTGSAPAISKEPPTTKFRVSTGLKPASSRAPTTMPTNRDEYASFVIKASTIATMGGTSDQNVPMNSMFPPQEIKQAMIAWPWIFPKDSLRP